MRYLEETLRNTVNDISHNKNYEQLFAFYRLWFDIGLTYRHGPSDPIMDDILNENLRDSADIRHGELIYSTTHSILRFASDAESDPILAPHSLGLQSRLCARILSEFFDHNLGTLSNKPCPGTPRIFYADANLIAHWANLGFVEEAAIRSHILQSLISHPKLYEHQADALYILFTIAGATFGAYAEPAVVDRCFELLRYHSHRVRATRKLIQEVIELREHGWEGLPPPPVFTTGKPKSTGADQKGPTVTPAATPPGLPNGDLEPQVPQLPPLESVTTTGADSVPASPGTQSPSIGTVVTLSHFTIVDASDDESPIDLTALVRHETFYLEDGNVEVLCGNTLFRVHASVLSFHSPALRQMFTQANLAVAESPDGFPRILSSDTATDFTTLLKIIYLPEFPERSKVPDFATFSSLLRITAKYELPTVRSQLLEIIHDAYPEAFEGLIPSKPLGENTFSGPTPHPNAILNLFDQQNLTSALPMAYYMAARKGLDSLMDRRLPQDATLSPEILQSAVGGLMTLREMERDEIHCLIFGPKGSHPCSSPNCPSHTPTTPATLGAYQKVFDHVVGSPQLGTKVLQVPKFCEDCEGDFRCVDPGICSSCVERWESGHADLRKNAWEALPDVFRLKG